MSPSRLSLFFDAFRLRAAKAVGSPEVNKATVRSLAALGDPADILAAICVQKSCVDAPGCAEEFQSAFGRFLFFVTKAVKRAVAT